MIRESEVFKRTGDPAAELSDGTYNMVIGLVLCWGFLVNWVIVREVDPAWLLAMDPRGFLLGYLASCFLGYTLYCRSEEPAISFIGYNFVVAPVGLVLSVGVSRHHPDLVMQAIQITGGVTVLMLLLGSLFPQFFQAIHKTLFVSLLCVLVVELFQFLVLGIKSGWTNWVVAVIFCGYIGYDWGRANQIPKTIDNAVDSAAEIYMDIVNLFVRILRILGRRR